VHLLLQSFQGLKVVVILEGCRCSDCIVLRLRLIGLNGGEVIIGIITSSFLGSNHLPQRLVVSLNESHVK
jgi:hypothetical protein